MALLARLALTAVALTRPEKERYEEWLDTCDWITWQHGVVNDHFIVERPEEWDFWLPCDLQ